MSIFVLVHGAWHGAWCWEALVPELHVLGHEAIAVDLPCDDVDAGIARYADIVCDALPSGREDITLVGHSLGGLTVPVVAERHRAARLVFLCAMLPSPGKAVLSSAAAAAPIERPFVRDDSGRLAWDDAAAATAALYADCPADVAARARARLRPQALTPMTDRSPMHAWPDVPRAAIICRDDAVLDYDVATGQARAILGVEPLALAGAHSPFLSRPAELARLLDSLAGDTAPERTS